MNDDRFVVYRLGRDCGNPNHGSTLRLKALLSRLPTTAEGLVIERATAAAGTASALLTHASVGCGFDPPRPAAGAPRRTAAPGRGRGSPLAAEALRRPRPHGIRHAVLKSRAPRLAAEPAAAGRASSISSRSAAERGGEPAAPSRRRGRHESGWHSRFVVGHVISMERRFPRLIAHACFCVNTRGRLSPSGA